MAADWKKHDTWGEERIRKHWMWRIGKIKSRIRKIGKEWLWQPKFLKNYKTKEEGRKFVALKMYTYNTYT